MKRKLAITLAVCAFLASTVSCDLFGPKIVQYKALCTSGTVDITMSGKGGSIEQYTTVPSGWTKEFEAKKDDFVYVSAQNNQASGTVTVYIYVKSKEFKTATASGAYVIATAAGSVE